MVATFQLAAPQLSPSSWNPLVIDNFPGSPGADTHLYDAALSTTAGPVDFPPYPHPQFGWCVDGGLFAKIPPCWQWGGRLMRAYRWLTSWFSPLARE